MQVVGVASTFTGVWVEVAGLIAELDVLAGFADLAIADPTRPYCKPEIVDRDEGDIVIKVCVSWCNIGNQTADAFSANCTVRPPGLCSA
jgi:DNA mismatch repair protein MSH2